MKKIVTMGEVMLRLSPPNNERFFQAKSLHVEFGGSEANVGAALAYWGMDVTHLSAFPDHEIGWAASASLRKNGINTTYIRHIPGRMGVYFLEHGSMQRSSQIIYDRVGSSFSRFDGKDLPWDEIFRGAEWFHWSGITPALSQESADLTLTAVQKASEMGLKVSGDLNYRSNLWQFGKKPHEVMPTLMEYTHLMIAGARDFNQCLGFEFENFETAKNFAFATFKRLQYISTTERISHSSSHNTFSANLYSETQTYSSKTYELTHIVDRVGTGDAFGGGLIYGLLTMPISNALEFAVAACALKHSVPGDVLICSKAEIEELIAGNYGKIKR
jgi:2-dehydro-3-deoxygluconokinase